MAEKSFRLQVVTPERVMFDGQVTSMMLPASDGLMGVLPNHAPILALLGVGEATVVDLEGNETLLMISDGFFEMRDNEARLLADVGERAEDIDAARAEEAERRAQELMKRSATDRTIDMERAHRALTRAQWRVRVSRDYKERGHLRGVGR